VRPQRRPTSVVQIDVVHVRVEVHLCRCMGASYRLLPPAFIDQRKEGCQHSRVGSSTTPPVHSTTSPMHSPTPPLVPQGRSNAKVVAYNAEAATVLPAAPKLVVDDLYTAVDGY
jgi:hypothetical protein